VHTTSKGSAAEGRLVVGIQSVREVLRAHGARTYRVIVERKREPGPTLEALARFARDQGVHVERWDRSELDRLAQKEAGGAAHQGAVAFAPELVLGNLHKLLDDAPSFFVALDEIEDPQNFGAIVRSAVALGAFGVVFPEHHAAPLTPATFRASAGAVEFAKLYRVASLPRAVEELRAAGAFILGLDGNAAQSLRTATAEGVSSATSVGIVVGSEGKGLRKAVKAACSALGRISMPGPIASLNASVAAAIAIYEAASARYTPTEGTTPDATPVQTNASM
jgi:23S rRNA (guanosine2251-2'-O)-methyltransferase